jgi:hypothetical protein
MVSPLRIKLLKIESVRPRVIAADGNELCYTPLPADPRDVRHQMDGEPDRLPDACMR